MAMRRALSLFLAAGLATFVAEATTVPALNKAVTTPAPAAVQLPVSPAQLPPVLPFCDNLCGGSDTQLSAVDTCFGYRYGRNGLPVDYDAMRISCGSAAAAGNADAQTLMGELSFLGLGRGQDFTAAASWYAQAAAQGHPHAQLMMYEMTRLNLIPSATAAAEWLAKAAAAGHPQATALKTRI